MIFASKCGHKIKAGIEDENAKPESWIIEFDEVLIFRGPDRLEWMQKLLELLRAVEILRSSD